ncbi:hypothetical protein PHISCL_02025 [Aspergillus sclerotialis]|uniref:Large ribosomal subunit protein bL32m n=1 Tax=Aspergillus sclerotialis TaxID=2070753 RepID=A0A3A2ZR32_9EURO|nr:hypothetical protein PHISCL_02025 [Aspergillus sclerotialis]
MALRILPSVAQSRMFPVTRWSLLSRNSSVYWQAFFPSITISLNVPGFLSDIWESILRAVPKKKTSHMKKRHRQMAGKALKDVKNLRTCPGCGQMKRSHVLCPYCVQDIKKQWKATEAA